MPREVTTTRELVKLERLLSETSYHIGIITACRKSGIPRCPSAMKAREKVRHLMDEIKAFLDEDGEGGKA